MSEHSLEGQLAHFRSFLERIEWSGGEYYHGDWVSCCLVCGCRREVGHTQGCDLATILATPDTGAGAVLSAADRVYDTEVAFAARKAAEVAKGMRGNARYHEWPELLFTIEAQEMLLDAVAEYRKKHEGSLK